MVWLGPIIAGALLMLVESIVARVLGAKRAMATRARRRRKALKATGAPGGLE